jgi:hypothetical protein
MVAELKPCLGIRARKRLGLKTPPPDIRAERVPRGYCCSTCSRTPPRLVVITCGTLPYWYGFCSSCVDEMAEAAEGLAR